MARMGDLKNRIDDPVLSADNLAPCDKWDFITLQRTAAISVPITGNYRFPHCPEINSDAVLRRRELIAKYNCHFCESLYIDNSKYACAVT